jgi:mucin-19
VTYSAGCSGPATAVYTAGTRVLSGLTGIAMTAGTASCTVTVAGVTNQPGQVNASCAATPAAFTNVPAGVTATNATNTSVNRCLVVSTTVPTLTKAFAPATILAGATATLTITLSNPNTVAAALTAVLTDPLPTGLVVAATPNAATTCSGAGAVTAAAGGSTVSLPVTRSIPAGSSTTPGTCTVTVDVTSDLGAVYTNTIAAGALQTSNGNNAAPASANLTVNAVPPTIVKLVTLISDSVNGTTNPRAIPGAILEYTLLITNPSVAMTNNSVVVTDILSTNLALCVNATCGAGATPVSFTDGTPTSALTLPAANTTFSQTATPAVFTYTPVAGANGCDPSVSTIRVNPSGVFADGTAAGADPSFTLKFRACIK